MYNTVSSDPELIFFLGAGASLPCGISGVIGLVEDFRKWLQEQHKQDYLAITDHILAIMNGSGKYNTEPVDIEKLLDVVKKLENSENEILLDFYINKESVLTETEGYHLISNGRKILSEEIKRFIKTSFTEKKLGIDYLKPLKNFIAISKPLEIFSTNYDICIEAFCSRYDLKYVDGFNPSWNLREFDRTDVDVKLYKIHGSVRWYRTEEGYYESSKIKILDMKAQLDSGEDVIPLILYPGEKLDYMEPVFDMLGFLKKHLDHAKYVFVIGYSFRDEYLSIIFKYAANRNRKLIVFLIGPESFSIYYNNLKTHIDKGFKHGFTLEGFDEGFDKAKSSKLAGRVLFLPYKIESIFPILKKQYLDNLKQAERLEEQLTDAIGDERRSLLKECIIKYMNCGYIEKVEELIENNKEEWKDLAAEWQFLFQISLQGSLKSLLSFGYSKSNWQNHFAAAKQIFQHHNFIFVPTLRMQTVSDPPCIELKFRPNNVEIDIGELIKYFEKTIIPMLEADLKITTDHDLYGQTDQIINRIKHFNSYLNLWANNKMTFDKYLIQRQHDDKNATELTYHIKEFKKQENEETQEGLKKLVERIEIKELKKIESLGV